MQKRHSTKNLVEIKLNGNIARHKIKQDVAAKNRFTIIIIASALKIAELHKASHTALNWQKKDAKVNVSLHSCTSLKQVSVLLIEL